jgi:phage protein D
VPVAQTSETLNVRREKSWHKTTVGEVVKEIATRHSLKVAIGKDVAAQALDHLTRPTKATPAFDEAGAAVRRDCIGEG